MVCECNACVQELSGRAAELDTKLLDKKIDQMMPELGFAPDDNDRLVASYRYSLTYHLSAKT